MINGIYRLSANLKTKPPITSQQVAKFANYFLSRSIVQSPKGVVSYLSSIKVLATNDFEKPVCIALANKGVVSSKQSLLEVKVCDILGNPLPSIPGVIADSVKTEGNVEISNKKLPFQPSSSDKYVSRSTDDILLNTPIFCCLELHFHYQLYAWGKENFCDASQRNHTGLCFLPARYT